MTRIALLALAAGILLSAPDLPAQPRDLRAWELQLDDASPEVRTQAIAALARFGAPAVPALMRSLEDRHPRVRQAAAEALGPLGAAAHRSVPALAARVCDPVREVRYAAALSLGWMRARKPAAARALLAALQDRWSWVRAAAATSLGELAILPGETVRALVAAVGDPDPFVRDHATRALGWVLRRTRGQVPVALEALDATDWRIRLAVVRAFDIAGPAALSAADALRRMRDDSYAPIREAAGLALVSVTRPPR